jgi:ADP-heptose:LPS heptosyltransferase
MRSGSRISRAIDQVPKVSIFETIAIHSCGEVIGDGLFKLSFLQECRRRFPDAHITWIAGLSTSVFAGPLAPMVEGLIDEVVEDAGIGTFGQLIAPRSPLSGRRFDLVIDTQRNFMRTLCAKRIRHGEFLASTADFRLSSVRPDDQDAFPRSLLHQFSFLLDLVSDAPAGLPAPIPVGQTYHDQARVLLPEGPTYVGFAPGAGDLTKVWPLENFLELARRQRDLGHVPVFILGPGEEALLDRIRAALPDALLPSTVAGPSQGPSGPALVIALGGRMTAAVSNDSGAGHMLAFSQVPLVSLYSKADPRKYVLDVPRLVIIDSKNHGGKDPALIPLEDVARALENLLDDPV